MTPPASRAAARLPSHLPPPVSPRDDFARAALAVQLVALTSGIPAPEIASRARGHAAVARARQTAMYLAHTAYGWPLARVGQAFGRDRTTAGHACALIEDERDDPSFDATLQAMEAMLRAAPEGLLA